MTIKAIRGFKDILPDEAAWWQRVEETARRVLNNFSYREIRIPVVEKTELFARSIGQDTDIVEKEMFTFPDRHGDPLTLRPEATAGVVRSVIEHSQAGDGRPLKLYVIGPMFRYERPQKGRQRQFHQLDVEAFNDPSPHMDAEIIVLLTHFLTELGLTDLSIHLNSLGCPDCRPLYKTALLDYLSGHRDELCPDCRRRLDTNPLRIIDCKVPRCSELAAKAPGFRQVLCPDCREHHLQMRADLEAAALTNVVEDDRLVRGLDYYSRTVFEVRSGELGAQNAVAGGGRYDALARSLGGPDIPGIGFAVGLERLIMLLAERGGQETRGPELFVAILDQGAVAQGFKLAQQLRRQGRSVEIDYAPGSLKSKMKRADKLAVRRVLILGPEELARGQAILRDMTTKAQETVPLDGAVDFLSRVLEGE